ncbi:MAG: tail fiber domain-containing protein [Bacteroidia bacterium]
MKKLIFYSLSVLLLLAKQNFAQNVGINATGATPDNSAMLDVAASNKGVLIPRVALTSTTDVTTIASPATSLMVYNTATAGTPPNNVTPGYYYWNGTVWVRVATDGDNWKLTGNAGTNPSSNFLGTTDANDLQIRVNNISKIHIRSDAAGTNRVGIGTNFATVYTPSATPTLLHVHDGETGANDFALITLGSSKSTATNKLGELHYAATGVASADRRTAGIESYLAAVTAGPNVSGDLRFFTNNSGSYSEKVRIQSNGRVGIGTTTPAGQLDVVQVTPNPTALFSNYGNVNDIYFQRAQGTLASPTIIGSGGILGRLRANGYDGSNFQSAAEIKFEVDATSSVGDMPGRIVFSTTPDGSTTLSERMRINNAGFVGIGTNNPLVPLHVIKSSNYSAGNGSNNDGPTTAIITASSASRQNDWPNAWGGGLSTWDIVGASTFMTGYVTRSDERFKKDIMNINSGLKSVMDLRPVSYILDSSLESDQQEHLHFGFIAQEVEKLFPNLVVTTINGYKGMNYQELIPILTKAVQEQQAIIESQKNEIDLLKKKSSELDMLKAEIDLIKTQLNAHKQTSEK